MDPSPDFTAAADRLYAVPPAEFVATRDAEVIRAHGEGRHDEARAMAKLRRPTQSAWLVNKLVRERMGAIEDLLALSDDFRDAYVHGSGDQMREVSGRRQRLVTTLVRDGRRLGEDAGVRMSADTCRDVEGTLGAALVDPAVADKLRQGRLTAAVPYAGFGPAWPTPTVPTARSGDGSTARAVPLAVAEEPAAQGAAGRQLHEADERRRRDEERLAGARAAVAEAEREVDEREQALQSATRRRERVQAELERLRDKIRDTEERLTALDRGVRAESKRRQRAVDGLATARRGLDNAVRRAT